MSDTKVKQQKIQYTVRVGKEVMPLPVYCRRVKLSLKVVYSRIKRRKLKTKEGYIEFNPFLEPGDEILSIAHLPTGGTERGTKFI
jgi:hypothetical protein